MIAEAVQQVIKTAEDYIAFTVEELLGSKEYKDWVKTEVVLVHNCYYDSKEPYQAYIVIHRGETKGEQRFTITRFFKGGSKIQVSLDYLNVELEQVFKLLLTEYSSGLK